MNWCALIVIAAVGCSGAGSTSGQPIPAADVARIRELVKTARTKADAYATARSAGLRAAWGATDLGASGAPCPVSLPTLPPFRDWSSQTPAERDLLDIAHWRMTVVAGSAVLGEPPPRDEKVMQTIEREAATKGPRRDQFERQSAMLLRIADDAKVPEVFKTPADVLALATEIGGDVYWNWELVVVTTEDRHALFNPDGFLPGSIKGKAFLWSFKDGRVVCAAPVSATNQDHLELELDPNDKHLQEHQLLNDDLKNEAYRAAITGLRAVP